ncbi:MAG: hypothetical protein U9R75_09920 [Candidatus Thermoplasmatota archaeon]|nr:hypothetical protein [Candidatus Thermoplasmatota archaeon]
MLFFGLHAGKKIPPGLGLKLNPKHQGKNGYNYNGIIFGRMKLMSSANSENNDKLTQIIGAGKGTGLKHTCFDPRKMPAFSDGTRLSHPRMLLGLADYAVRLKVFLKNRWELNYVES